MANREHAGKKRMNTKEKSACEIDKRMGQARNFVRQRKYENKKTSKT